MDWSKVKFFKENEFACKCGCGFNNINPQLVLALDMARLGIIPAVSYRNQDFFGPRVAADEDLEPGMLDALYDPQTSGGLLIAAPAADVDELARRLHAEGRVAAVVGRVCEAEPGGPAVRVVR